MIMETGKVTVLKLKDREAQKKPFSITDKQRNHKPF